MKKPDYSCEKVKEAAKELSQAAQLWIEKGWARPKLEEECHCPDCTQFGMSMHEEDYV